MSDYILPLWDCPKCGLQSWTWEAAARTSRNGCPGCERKDKRDGD